MIQCGTCGYPLLPEERTGLVEVNGKMQKPWAWLTNDEINELWGEYEPSSWYEFVREVEIKIKEKNG